MSAVALILLGFVCLAGVIVGLVFMIIAFANNKPGKFAWLAGVLLSALGLAACIFFTVQKAVHKVEELSMNAMEGYANTLDSIDGHAEDNRKYVLTGNKQIELLKSYSKDTLAKEQFYTYFGFRDYYRFPLRYPYAIHCIDLVDNGSLYNEKSVDQFDKSDNGEIDLNIPGIKRLAFDGRFLLLEQQNEIPGANEHGNSTLYKVFEFDKDTTYPAKSLKQLFSLARQKGYTGPDTLMTIEQYNGLF